MSRTTIEVEMKTKQVDDVLQVIASKVEPLGFKKKILDGETVWSKGDGVILQMQCFGAVFTDHSVLLQGWMKDALMGEKDLEGGFMARLPKKQMKRVLDDISSTIQMQKL